VEGWLTVPPIGFELRKVRPPATKREERAPEKVTSGTETNPCAITMIKTEIRAME